MQGKPLGKLPLRIHRAYARVSQAELARRTGLSLNQINRIDTEQSAPSGPTLQKIAAALGIDANDIDLSYADREAA